MIFKKVLIAVCSFIFISSFSSENVTASEFYKIQRDQNESFFTKNISGGYTYVHVFKDGIWWIQVYNDQGILVDEYPEE